MKRTLLNTLLCLCTAVFAHAQTDNMFDRFSEMDGITSVYISKAMLNMIPDIQSEIIDLKGIAGKLESVKVLNSEKESVINKMKDTANQIFTPANGYETLVRIRDNDDHADIYLKTNDNNLNEFVVLTQETKELTIIVITGQLSPEDIKNIIQQ